MMKYKEIFHVQYEVTHCPRDTDNLVDQQQGKYCGYRLLFSKRELVSCTPDLCCDNSFSMCLKPTQQMEVLFITELMKTKTMKTIKFGRIHCTILFDCSSCQD
jgi:hypothetical protein